MSKSPRNKYGFPGVSIFVVVAQGPSGEPFYRITARYRGRMVCAFDSDRRIALRKIAQALRKLERDVWTEGLKAAGLDQGAAQEESPGDLAEDQREG
jgi:hypothetical protein